MSLRDTLRPNKVGIPLCPLIRKEKMTADYKYDFLSLKCPYCSKKLYDIAKITPMSVFSSHLITCPRCEKTLYLNTELILSVSNEPVLPVSSQEGLLASKPRI